MILKRILKAAERLFTGAIVATIIIAIMTILSCGEDTEDVVTERPEGAAGTFGEIKLPEIIAAAPQAPNVGAPSVKEVGYYSDWKLTKPIELVVAGDTIYTKVVFSEPMQHIAADDKTARPVLYYRIGDQSIRYRIAAHGAKGEAFQSGDAKPKGKSTSTFVCRYTLPADTTGAFTLAVGKLSADTDGNTLSAFYTHKEKVRIEEPDTIPPFVLSVTYWHDAHLTEPITDTVYRGENIYTKIVFSEEMKVVGGNTKQSRPILYYRIDRQNIPYRIRLAAGLLDGEARTEDSITFICRNIVPDTGDGTLQIVVGRLSADLQGNTLSAFYTHRERVQMKTWRPPTVLAGTGVINVNRRPCVRLVYFRPKNQPIKQDDVERLRTLAADANRYYADEMQRHGFGRKTFAIETDADSVPIVHIVEGLFREEHYRPDGKHRRGVVKAKDEILKRYYPDAPQHVYFFRMDLTRSAFRRPGSEDVTLGVGGLHFNHNKKGDAPGGYAIVPAGPFSLLSVTMHELGHAFGLGHDFRSGRSSDLIMAYGSSKRLSPDAAEWLSVSVFFNDIVYGSSPGNISLVPDPKHTPQGVRISFQAEDQDGLHQMQLLFEEEIGPNLIAVESLQGLTDTAEFVSPKVRREFTEKIILQIIDKKGGITQRHFPPIN